MDIADVRRVLIERYGVRNPDVQPLPDSWAGRVYLATDGGSARWIVRITEPLSAAHDVHVLSFLEERDYPASRLVRTLDGAESLPEEPFTLLVTSYIEGEPAEFSPEVLGELGAKLGRLHALDWWNADLPEAEMLPATDMATAIAWLEGVPPLEPGALHDWRERLLDAAHAIDPGDHLPLVLIHNDAHPGNALVTPAGEALYIDWHGAGLGPAMVDLGFLLVSSVIAPSWATPTPTGGDRIKAIVEGYTRHRTPTPEELAWLPDAIRFRSLLYGAGHLTAMARENAGDLAETWWWERYEAADEITMRVEELLS